MYDLGDPQVGAGGVVATSKTIWISAVNALEHVDIPTGKFTQYVAPACCPQDLALGPDGNFWSTLWSYSNSAAYIGRMTPAGVWTTYPLGSYQEPGIIITGPDGRLWFTTSSIGQNVAAMTTGGVIGLNVYVGNTITGLTNGPDGNVWLTETGQSSGSGDIGRVTPQGQLTRFSTPTQQHTTNGIVAGSDGNLWFAEWYSSHPGIIASITTTGSVTEYPVTQNRLHVLASTGSLIWFSHQRGLATFDINTHVVQELGLFPGEVQYTATGGMALGPDGNMWFGASDGYDLWLAVFVRNIIKASPTSLTLTVGQQAQLSASEHPAHALSASSSNPKVASVTGGPSPFTVTGNKVGTCNIIITDGNYNFFHVAVTVH